MKKLMFQIYDRSSYIGYKLVQFCCILSNQVLYKITLHMPDTVFREIYILVECEILGRRTI